MNVLEKQKEIRIQKIREREAINKIKEVIEDIYYNLDFSSLDNLTNISNMFLNCSNLTSAPDFLNDPVVIGSEEQINSLRRGQL